MTAEPWSVDVPDPVIDQVVDVDGTPMSGLVAHAADPRAVIVAIHGGATRAAYFDHPGHPDKSLLRLASSIGYTVVALDRPGYGSSRPFADDMNPAARVDLAYGAIDRFLAGRPQGAGTFLLAHSAGCELAVRMAADRERGQGLLGLELSGTGLQHSTEAHEVLGDDERNAPGAGVRKLLWEPASLYPSEVIGGAMVASRTPPFEGSTVRAWPRETFRELAPAVTAPVHFTAAEFERVWRQDDAALADIAALFSGSSAVTVERFAGGGHNLSIGHMARAYHLAVLSFIESCVARRVHPVPPPAS
ncbi:alpha/beta fold hydrolase [Gordonia sp. LSe1-13]|uniref:Alpha/beta fold hydrolase n=1 Tax=Gordonia sesuvii TaxID=3116777 RepID=A0ABU7M8R0_9ACTN|nr:alpha/beta fold hydrolase [Gordonia sp. LSe1-13]